MLTCKSTERHYFLTPKNGTSRKTRTGKPTQRRVWKCAACRKQFSVLKLNNSRVRVLALKKAEQSDELVVRVVEMDGKPASNVHLSFASPVTAAREVNGQEQPVGSASHRRQ